MASKDVILDNVKKYINNPQKSTSAFLIKGSWGCGKTYFVKNILAPDLKNSKLSYVSLNGMASIDEFLKRIRSIVFSDQMKIFKRVNENDTSNMEIITGIDSFFDDFNLQGAAGMFKGMSTKFKKFVSKKNISSRILIFDDLERCKIPIAEILGTINDLIEHEGCKCILIANEEELFEQEKYIKIKEKFISQTFEYVPNLIDFLKKERSNNKNTSFLSDESLETFALEYENDVNLRTLQATFTITDSIFETLVNLDDKKNLIQRVFYEILETTYNIKLNYTKGENRPFINDDVDFTNLSNLKKFRLKGALEFINEIVYDGVCDKKRILEKIKTHIEIIQSSGTMSPISELKGYYYMEDDQIQEKLDYIATEIKTITFREMTCVLNIIIPLLEFGFTFGGLTDYDDVLNAILSIDINVENNDKEFLENHNNGIGRLTNLENKQLEKFKIGLNRLESKLANLERCRQKTRQQEINNILIVKNWADLLKLDKDKNKMKDRMNGKYLSYFDTNLFSKALFNSSNKQLTIFRDVIDDVYGSRGYNIQFEADIDSASNCISVLENVRNEIASKINKMTIGYIINDLKRDFQSDI